MPITRLTGDGEELAMGTDTSLYAVDPASQYVEALFDAVRWKPFPGGKSAVNDFGYFDGAAELFHLMISEQPLLPLTKVDLNRRDVQVGDFLYRHAGDQLDALGLDYLWLISQGGAQLGNTGMGSAYYRPPELVKLLADATDHIDVTDATLAEVTDIYEGRFRIDPEQEFAIFVDIIDQLLGLFRASARNGFGIVSQMD